MLSSRFVRLRVRAAHRHYSLAEARPEKRQRWSRIILAQRLRWSLNAVEESRLFRLMEAMGMHGRHGIGHSTNLVGRPSDLLASCEFNENPAPLCIWGVREMNRSLFDMLAQAGDLHDAGEAFYVLHDGDVRYRPRTAGESREEGPAAGAFAPRSSADQGLGLRQQRPRRGRAQGLGRKPLRHLSRSYHKEVIEGDSSRRLDHLCGGEDVEPLPQQRDLGSARPAFRILPMGNRALCLSGPNACDAIPGGQRVRRAPDCGTHEQAQRCDPAQQSNLLYIRSRALPPASGIRSSRRRFRSAKSCSSTACCPRIRSRAKASIWRLAENTA